MQIAFDFLNKFCQFLRNLISSKCVVNAHLQFTKKILGIYKTGENAVVDLLDHQIDARYSASSKLQGSTFCSAYR